jgi:hypothetical protein
VPIAKVRRRQHAITKEQTNFYDPENGHLTMYALSCGYIEEYICASGCEFRMYMEHGVFSVRGRHTHGESTSPVTWETFDNLRSARQFAKLHGKFMPASDAFSGI